MLNKKINLIIPAGLLVITFLVFILLGIASSSYGKKYEVTDKQDLSYTNCKRVLINLLVQDDLTSDQAKDLTEKVFDDEKGNWDDISIWAYYQKDKLFVGNTARAVAEKRQTVCE